MRRSVRKVRLDRLQDPCAKISSNGSSPTNRLTVPKGTYTEEADIGFDRSTDLSVLISPPRISTVKREPSLRGSAEIMDLADPEGNTFSSNIRKPTTAKIADLTLTPTTDLNSRNPTVPNIGGQTEPRSAIKITQPKSSPPLDPCLKSLPLHLSKGFYALKYPHQWKTVHLHPLKILKMQLSSGFSTLHRYKTLMVVGHFRDMEWMSF